jgi:hypothetical protein
VTNKETDCSLGTEQDSGGLLSHASVKFAFLSASLLSHGSLSH